MNRSIAVLLIFLGCTIRISAQLSEGGQPASMSISSLKSAAELPRYRLKQFNRQVLNQQDGQHPTPFRYAVFEDVNIDLKREGRKDILQDNSGTIWRLKFESDSAYSIQLILSKFFIPYGAKLFVYNENLTQIAGAFTCNNMQSDSTFVIADIPGNKVIIEYFEPAGADFTGKIVIGSIGKAYKDIFGLTIESDYIGINCPEGKDLQDVKHSVCKITFRSDSGSYLCTGALLNNARNDEIPYFLTANHCISTSAEASTLVAYFNYERADCNGTALNSKTLSGSTLLTSSPASDYTLLRLNQKPTAVYQPYYAGWNAENQVFDHVSGVHHPEGLTKKLAIDNDTIKTNSTAIQWQEGTASPVASHWQLQFDVGKTAGGSSGSPLFNKKKQVIGQLHGGDQTYDFYGKLSYSWIHPLSKYKKLSYYLDPDTTGITSLEGHYPSTNAPDAFIAIPFARVCVQAPVKLTDYSVFSPFTRTWTITPSTYAFVAGNSSSASPVIKFLQAGNYSVQLKATNANGRDSMKLTNAFQAGTTINVGINALPAGESCLCNFDHFIVFGSGATSYSWDILPDSEDKISLDKSIGDTVSVSLAPGFVADSSLKVNLKVTGTQGTCSDSQTLAYDLILQANDSVKDARLISYGKTKVFSNKCATVEAGEPSPPAYSCTTQYSWCDEYGTGKNILDHSVWFKFVAAPQGFITVSSSGFDDELALYDASSYVDILNHNYTILAANDDRSTTDFNPLLKSVPVTPGKTYWIQVDGSGGGLQDNFYLQLTAMIVTDVPGTKENEFVVYPQPASDVVYVKGDALLTDVVHLRVYSLVGVLVEDETKSASDGILTINTKSWDRGVYILKIGSGAQEFVTRIVKY
jgi:V8-like Glu-specific endopeptidase